MPVKSRVVIVGAAGRDFHDFNVVFRKDQHADVVAFTATQIPNIANRRYPAELAGELYPNGIPIISEDQLETFIERESVDQVIFSYSDVSHSYVMHLASRVLSAGADFRLLGPKRTMLTATKPVVAVCAVRTGSGKSQTSRRVVENLQELGFSNVVAVRHPMPYGNLVAQAVQRFEKQEDLEAADCTIEEREEYEPYLEMGAVVYAGVDYRSILSRVQSEADVIVWDGGNNDLPFFKPDLHIVVTDPHRPGDELAYHPGETNLRSADVAIINKIDTADHDAILSVRANIQRVNPNALIIQAASPFIVADPDQIRGKRVLVVEDGPTLTHGEMPYGAGYMAAHYHGAAEIIDPRPHATGSIADTFTRYDSTGPVLPAMGYGATQMGELEKTINATSADLVLVATPVDLGRLLDIDAPYQRVRYSLQEVGQPTLMDVLRNELVVGKK
ncbi:MAG: cyclic 2,3-diphosphoglycerate synthase [Candidatus Promineifilaceae bacterium]|nr:cyclic 2,3-diphosphoglycerate synthase [Candidatus Promineifilaceae bacterium]